VEGAGKEEQPTDTHPDIYKLTACRRNCLSVSRPSLHVRLKINFESCHPKSFETVDAPEHSEETLQLSVIKTYPEATKPISPSKIVQHPHKSHLPRQHLYNTQKSEGWGDKEAKACGCTAGFPLRSADPRQMSGCNPTGRKGSAPGSSARLSGASATPAASACDARALYAWEKG